MPKKTKAEYYHANRVNLPEFLRRNGFELKKEGQHEYRWRGISGASVSIKDNAEGEVGLWNQWSMERGGTNIDFVMQFLGKTKEEAVDMLNGDAVFDKNFVPPKEAYTSLTEPEKKLQAIKINVDSNSNRVKAYLSQTRGLQFPFVNRLIQSGKIVQEKDSGNACFLIQDSNGKTIGAEKVGTSTYQKFKGIATGSASGHGFEICYGKGEKLLFFESAIDALSFAQMHAKKLNNHRLVSMMGVKPSIVTATMQRYKIPPERVWICSDNDEAGNEFARRLKAEYPEMHRLKTPERFKDWNDQLRNIEKVQEKRHQLLPPYDGARARKAAKAVAELEKQTPHKSQEKTYALE